jgi:hypothetical protein
MKISKITCSLVAGLLLAATPAFSVHAQEDFSTLAPPIAEAPAQMKEFGFLAGSWAATSKRFLPDGTQTAEYRGEWDARFVDDGRVIFDAVTWFSPAGEKVLYDATLRTFGMDTGEWEMVYLSSLTSRHSETFRGKFIDGEGHFNADISLSPENSVMARIRFHDIEKDSFEWAMQLSVDGGENWFLGETISAKRVN